MKKILIANRGEIALRVMRTAKQMGIKTVAVFSTADRHSPHVRFADEAIWIGESPSSESYLSIPRIIEVAKKTGSDAIHPGYGFLSENANFAKAVEENNLIFIGPKAKTIQMMGDKLAAKAAVSLYNIPMVPGTDSAVEDIKIAKQKAKEIGYPVLIKAAAGGGGKGMRIVNQEIDFDSQMARAVGEATAAFGNGSVFIEKYVTSPRHIEIQILADSHNQVLHLSERECSVQRRHQKVMEEAPSVVLTPDLRNRMGAAAVNVARACDYLGAGTVEFLLDSDKNFYFLEMNTRLQVEHPVTELITGLDLVEQQIRIARGEALAFSQEDIEIKGHAIELRVYAEDSQNNFVPTTGNLERYRPTTGEHVRVDDGYEEGMDVPVYYDPLLSKLIVYGKNRLEAILLMILAIDSFEVEGVQTTLPFGKFVCQHEAFVSGQFDTNFVNNYYTPQMRKAAQHQEANLAAMIGLKIYLEEQKKLRLPVV